MSAARASAANTSLVGTATPGLTSTAGNSGSVIGSERISPMPRIMRARGSRQTGTSAPVACARGAQALVVERKPVHLRQQAQRSGRIGRAAAKPGRDRQLLVERETTEAQSIDARRPARAPP